MSKVIAFILILISLYYGTARSQFTITSLYSPSIGDSVESRSADTSGINQGESGPNRTWNYLNLSYTGTPSVEYFLSPSSTQYYTMFPNSNIASIHVFGKSATSMPHYWLSTDTAFYALGYVFPSSPLMTGRFTVPYERMHYPVYYGSSHNSTYRITVTYGNTVEYTYGTKSEYCDGYGTLILPNGTYTNVLRVKTIDDETDTVKVNGVVTQVYHNFSENYFWYVQGLKYSVFVISYQTYNNIYSKNVSYYAINETVGISRISSNVPDKHNLFQNYPNPFNPTTNIRFNIKKSDFTSLKIFDNIGNEISTLVNKKLTPGTYEVNWNAAKYPSGVYYCCLNIGNYAETKKMILIK